jgi:hypothetical protein
VELSKFGFFSDWTVEPKNNLCTPGGDQARSKPRGLPEGPDKILICTHATLRFAFEALEESDFDNVLLAIDEFHHVSADGENRLGELLRTVMAKSDVHIVAMTGSYFRGDSVPVLLPEDEAQFTKVTYNYYEQLNGYTFLKSLGIGYHFYQGKYTSAIDEVLNTDQKTILHIPVCSLVNPPRTSMTRWIAFWTSLAPSPIVTLKPVSFTSNGMVTARN